VSSNPPTVSVVIPARDAAESLPRALASVANQTYPNIIEVVVAAGDDATTAAVTEDVIVVDNPTGETPVGLNLGVEASTGEIIVRCDAQAVLPPEYVATAVATLLRTGADNVGGRQMPVGDTDWERAIGAAMSSPLGAGDARYRIGGEEGAVETVYLGVFRRSSLDRVGGFDEDFARTQDYELNHRLVASGGLVWFDPQLEVAYRPRPSLRALAAQYFQYGQAKRAFWRKHPTSLRWRQVLPPVLVLTLGLSLIGSIWVPLLLAISGVYLLTLLLGGLFTGESAWRVAASLLTMHMSWGFGFLMGKK
jgi:succinoglycan biosynthesis protein ExoA